MSFTDSSPADPTDGSLLSIAIESSIFGFLGIFIGTVINLQFKKIKSMKILMASTQLALSGLILGMMQKYIPIKFNHFRGTLAGMAFPACFFGSQNNIYSILQDALT